MRQPIDVLQRVKPRFLLFGSFALHAHEFSFGQTDADLNLLYRISMDSIYGRVPPVKIILRSKLHASRPKDYRHVMRVARKLLNIW
ncbi:hypothetical protein LF1_06870 [Rubripirellula obstinata]|uniref:Uncharacterized protein n=1 Tax=Rubripirellula obstinata TaxID=406547 RepID=A0A5B1CD88_9BACT|nr:hypothetical protein [Rubripirellula obstinata]KAA1258172.1 hypothetical protein LF1_06870 [Rubripirellula obstinata]